MKAKKVKVDIGCYFTIRLAADGTALVQLNTGADSGNDLRSFYVDVKGKHACKVIDPDIIRHISYTAFNARKVITMVESEVRSLVEDRVMEAILE